MTIDGRIKRLERERDHPANLGPAPEMVELWASLWTAAGLEESRAKVVALEFLKYCEVMGQAPTFVALMKWGYEDDSGDG